MHVDVDADVDADVTLNVNLDVDVHISIICMNQMERDEELHESEIRNWRTKLDEVVGDRAMQLENVRLQLLTIRDKHAEEVTAMDKVCILYKHVTKLIDLYMYLCTCMYTYT